MAARPAVRGPQSFDGLAGLMKDIFVAIIAHSIVGQYITANF